MEEVIARSIRFREELHRIPESAGREEKTCAAIRRELAEIPGIRVLPPFLKTDTVAFIDGAAPGANVTLRADIDALALQESTGVAFASTHPGMMHACGHDVHTAILLGAAEILAAKRQEFSGSVRLVFQPGEEGKAMAHDLISAGALQNPAPDFVTALHVEPGLPVGTFALKEGCMASSCIHYKVTFTGKSGHGSLPHRSVNPILAAASAIGQLQYVVTNRINIQKPSILSICSIEGGRMDNVIPETCSFGGTLRALNNDTSDELLKIFTDVCQAVASAHQVKMELQLNGNFYPAVINPASGVETALKVIGKLGYPVKKLEESAMSSEDFSCYLLNAPDGVFLRLGAGEDQPPLHNVKFLPPPEVIRPGIEYMVNTALEVLKDKSR